MHIIPPILHVQQCAFKSPSPLISDVEPNIYLNENNFIVFMYIGRLSKTHIIFGYYNDI